jgi:phosphatidylinositol alpha-1,6-mannosyltransferase
MSCLADSLYELCGDVVVLAPQCVGSADFDRHLPYRVVRYAASSRLSKLISIVVACLSESRSGEDYTIAALWFPSGLAASLLPRRVRGSLGVLVHGSEVAKQHGVRRNVMQAVLSRADRIIANSKFTSRLVAAAGIQNEVLVSPCGVADATLPRRLSKMPIVTSVGRLVRRKGFDKLLDAIAIVLRDRPDVICEIIGDGPERAALEVQAMRLGILDSIRFLGSVDDAELREAYSRAWCFALPVRRDGDDVEGFGIVYLEAGIAGIPAIGGLDSGASDVIIDGETGFLVDGNDVQAIAAAIRVLISDPDMALEMGQRARERARGFSWDASAQRIHSAMTS